MVVRLIFLSIFCRSFLQLVFGEINENCFCITPQYFEYGRRGTIIICNTQSDFNEIYWYNKTDTLFNLPVISWNKELGLKTGDGYSRLEYDIQPDGSLVINKTISQGNGYFKVVILSHEEIVCEQTVHIIAIAQPEQSYPIIDKCGSKRYCYKRCDIDISMQLNCYFDGPELFGTLVWELWTSGIPQTMQLGTSLANKGGNNRNVSVILPYTGHQLEVLVCKIATNHAYEINSSMILIERAPDQSNTQYPAIKPIYKRAQLNSTLRLECGKTKRVSFVWKKCHSENKDSCEETVHFSLETKVILKNGFMPDNTGSLFVEQVKVLHESWYWCLSSDGRQTTEKFYRVDVFALPVPPKLIVGECDGDKPCNVKSRSEGNLTCSLFGIRPEARLEWVVTSMNLPEIIAFSDRETRVISHDDVYDITIRTLYVIKHFQYSEIDLECKATVNITIISDLSTTVKLHLSDVDTSSDKNHTWIPRYEVAWIVVAIAWIVVAIALLCCFTIYIIKVCRKRQRNTTNEVEKVMIFYLSIDFPWSSFTFRHNNPPSVHCCFWLFTCSANVTGKENFPRADVNRNVYCIC